MSIIRTLISVVALILGIVGNAIAEPTLEEKLQILQQEIDSIKAQLAKQQQAQQQMPTPNPAVPGAAADGAAAAPSTAAVGSNTIGGYGEFSYNRYNDTTVNNNQADLRRFVLFLGHKFSDNLRFYSEVEWEHAVVSNTDQGESEIEQAFIDYHVNDAVSFKAGLFLIPLGILNETHEPPTYYGVERNFVETKIIPSTWREGGLQVYGEVAQGLQYQAGISTGFDAGKLADPAYGIRDEHQELQLASANDLSVHGALNYRAPGVLIGGGVFTGDTGQNGASNPLLRGVSARLTLWDMHAKYFRGNWDLQAVYARGTQGDAAQVSNALIAASGNPTLIAPQVLFGGYLQGAYHVWKRGDMDLAPFVRYERFNTQREVGAGYTPNPLNDERVITAGLNFKLHPQVVLKADFQRFRTNSSQNRFDLGLGYMF